MIHKITLLLAILGLILQSCTTDIEVNAPSLHANINGDFFRPGTKKAVLHEDGRLEITGTTTNQSIRISTYIDTKTANKAISKSNKKSGDQINIQSFDKKYTLENGKSTGRIIIDEIFDNHVSGSFYFTDLKDENGISMNIQNGWFYMLPIEKATDQKPEEPINPCLLNASLSANVNRLAMETNDHKAVPFGVRAPYSAIRITASNRLQDIELVFSINAVPGTYDLSGSGDYSATYSYDNDKSAAKSGTLTIINHDKETKCITGTFEYTTASGIEVTEGKFDYGY